MSRNTARTLIAALASLVIACGGAAESGLTDPELPSGLAGSTRKGKPDNPGGGGGGGGGGVSVVFTGNLAGTGTVKGNRNNGSSNAFEVTISTPWVLNDTPDPGFTIGKSNYCYDSVNAENEDGANHLKTLGTGKITGKLSYGLSDPDDHASFGFEFSVGGANYRLHAGIGGSVPAAEVNVVDDGEKTSVTVTGGRFVVTKEAGKGKNGSPGGTVVCLPVTFEFTATG